MAGTKHGPRPTAHRAPKADWRGVKERLARALGDYRTREELSVEELGQRLGVSRATAYNLVGGKPRRGRAPQATNVPDLDVLHRVCTVTHASADWLLYGVGPEYRGASRSEVELAADLSARVRQLLPDDLRSVAALGPIAGPDVLESFARAMAADVEEWRDWYARLSETFGDAARSAWARYTQLRKALPADPELIALVYSSATENDMVRVLELFTPGPPNGYPLTRLFRPTHVVMPRPKGDASKPPVVVLL